MIKNPFKPKRIGVGYLLRWHLIPRNPWFNVYLHKFIGDDDDRALHDHPWWSFSIRLRGTMKEHFQPSTFFFAGFFPDEPSYIRTPPRFCFRPPHFAHRLELVEQKPCWTLFITGPRLHEWGFHCPKGWKHWRTMAKPTGETIGGCD